MTLRRETVSADDQPILFSLDAAYGSSGINITPGHYYSMPRCDATV